MSRKFLVSLFILLAHSPLFSQSPPASNPQALAFAAQSIAALTGGKSISDVTPFSRSINRSEDLFREAEL
jgi:hypothetical protein